MGDVNVHSPTVVKKDGSWKWYKDGRLQKDNSVSYDNHSLSQRRRVKNRRWSDVHPFDAAKMNREKIKPARNKYIDHAQSKVPEEVFQMKITNNHKLRNLWKIGEVNMAKIQI